METPPNVPKEKKKGLPPIAWVGIGCGGLLLIGAIAIALLIGKGVKMAKEFGDDFANNPGKALVNTAVKLHPDIEILSQDDLKGEATVKVKSTGEEITFTYDDLAKGKISFETKDGTFSLDASDTENSGILLETPEGSGKLGGSQSAPEWLLVPESVTMAESLASWEDAETEAGSVNFTSDQNIEQLEQEFKSLYPEATLSDTNLSSNKENTSKKVKVIQLELPEPKTTINLTLTQENDGQSQGVINYSRKKN